MLVRDCISWLGSHLAANVYVENVSADSLRNLKDLAGQISLYSEITIWIFEAVALELLLTTTFSDLNLF